MLKTAEILAELLKLPARQRAKLAAELIESLDDSADPATAEAWLEEIDRRVMDVTRESTKLQSWPDVRKKIQRRLHRDRIA